MKADKYANRPEGNQICQHIEDWGHRAMYLLQKTLLRLYPTPQTFDEFLCEAVVVRGWYSRELSGTLRKIDMRDGIIVDDQSILSVEDLVNTDALRTIWETERVRIMTKMAGDFWGLGLIIMHIVVPTEADPHTGIPPFHRNDNSYYIPFLVPLSVSLRMAVPLDREWARRFISEAGVLQLAANYPLTRQ